MADDHDMEEKEKCLTDGKVKEDNEKPEKISENCLKKIVNILSVVTVFLLLALLGVTIAWYVVRVRDLKAREHEVCLPCGELKGHYDNTNVLDEFKRDDKQCCGTSSKILKRLIDKTTYEKYSSDLANNFFASSSEKCREKIPENPAAKVAGISFMEMTQDNSDTPKVHWNRTSPETFFKRDIVYKDGSLTITHPGFYYIFNQMKWFLNDSDNFPIEHEIVLQAFADGQQSVLLEGRMSRCNMVEESGETTSSIGAVFELQRNDKIFVRTSRPTDLAPCHHGNFFGLYHVADPVM